MQTSTVKFRQHLNRGERIGLLAGSGRFPITFAERAQAQGYSVFCLGIIGNASEELAEICDVYVATPAGKSRSRHQIVQTGWRKTRRDGGQDRKDGAVPSIPRAPHAAGLAHPSHALRLRQR